MNNSYYQVALNAYTINYLKGLEDRQIPYQKLISKSLIKHFCFKDPNIHLPIHVINDFFENVHAHFGINFFSKPYLSRLKLNNMGLCGNYMTKSNRVLPTLQSMIKLNNLLCTNQEINLNIMNGSTLISSRSRGRSYIGKIAMEIIWLHMTFQILKSAENHEWAAKKIYLTGKESDYPDKISINYRTTIVYEHEYCGILFDTITLSKQIISGTPNDLSENQLPKPALTLSGKIESMFDHMYSSNLPSLQTTAEIFGVSASTLKRRLVLEGTTYNSLMEQWRFRKGVSLLTETTLKIKEISDCLYYANSANFVRAFRRWSGTTPSEFRAVS